MLSPRNRTRSPGRKKNVGSAAGTVAAARTNATMARRNMDTSVRVGGRVRCSGSAAPVPLRGGVVQRRCPSRETPMPFHLPPINRRRFLAGAVAALASGRLAFADDADPNAVALLADTHIAADRARVVLGVNLTDHLTAAVKQVTALPHRPAAAV